MMSSQSQGFWAGGHESYLKALRRQQREKLQALRDALASETDPQIKRSLEDQIQAVELEFENKRKAADRGLYLNG